MDHTLKTLALRYKRKEGGAVLFCQYHLLRDGAKEKIPYAQNPSSNPSPHMLFFVAHNLSQFPMESLLRDMFFPLIREQTKWHR